MTMSVRGRGDGRRLRTAIRLPIGRWNRHAEELTLRRAGIVMICWPDERSMRRRQFRRGRTQWTCGQDERADERHGDGRERQPSGDERDGRLRAGTDGRPLRAPASCAARAHPFGKGQPRAAPRTDSVDDRVPVISGMPRAASQDHADRTSKSCAAQTLAMGAGFSERGVQRLSVRSSSPCAVSHRRHGGRGRRRAAASLSVR